MRLRVLQKIDGRGSAWCRCSCFQRRRKSALRRQQAAARGACTQLQNVQQPSLAQRGSAQIDRLIAIGLLALQEALLGENATVPGALDSIQLHPGTDMPRPFLFVAVLTTTSTLARR